jgi:hypothetical protein
MFDSPFKYRKINFQSKAIGELSYIEHVYDFRGKNNQRYLVFAEQYNYNVFAVKFCTHNRKNYSDRFNVLSHHHECNVSLRLSTSFSNNSAVLVLFSDFNIQHNGITAKQAIPP